MYYHCWHADNVHGQYLILILQNILLSYDLQTILFTGNLLVLIKRPSLYDLQTVLSTDNILILTKHAITVNFQKIDSPFYVFTCSIVLKWKYHLSGVLSSLQYLMIRGQFCHKTLHINIGNKWYKIMWFL